MIFRDVLLTFFFFSFYYFSFPPLHLYYPDLEVVWLIVVDDVIIHKNLSVYKMKGKEEQFIANVCLIDLKMISYS